MTLYSLKIAHPKNVNDLKFEKSQTKYFSSPCPSLFSFFLNLKKKTKKNSLTVKRIVERLVIIHYLAVSSVQGQIRSGARRMSNTFTYNNELSLTYSVLALIRFDFKSLKCIRIESFLHFIPNILSVLASRTPISQ